VDVARLTLRRIFMKVLFIFIVHGDTELYTTSVFGKLRRRERLHTC